MREFHLADRTISTPLPCFLMGIVNCTPDSFYIESRGGAALAARLISEGADVLDIGGESTRPGSSYVDEDEEISRVIPVIREVRKTSSIPISVDTRKCSVMKAAFDEGADILNDVSALEDDEALADFAAQKKIPVILMHKRGLPVSMQQRTDYRDVLAEVSSYLAARADFATSRGIDAAKIIVDPGIGFGKDLAGNLALIAGCGKLCGGRYPVLMALSRKSFLQQITGRTVQERLAGTVAANLVAAQNGAFMLRVHDVASCKDSLAVLKSLTGI